MSNVADRRDLHDRHKPDGVGHRPDPLVNTVTVQYNPVGFPNDITDTAQASVTVAAPPPPHRHPRPPGVPLLFAGADTGKLLLLAFVALAVGGALISAVWRRRAPSL